MPADAVGLDLMEVAPTPTPVAPSPPPILSPPPTSPAPVPTEVPPSSVEMQVVPDAGVQPQAAPVAKAPEGWRIAHAVSDLVPPRLGVGSATGGGILAAGVIAAIERRRRSRQRKHRAGSPFIVPDEELAATELSFRAAADFDRAEMVQLTLKLLRRAAPNADVLGLRVGSRQVAVRFGAHV